MHLIKQVLLGCTLLCSQVFAAQLTEFRADYKAFRFGRSLGTAHIELQHLENDRYRLSYASKVSLFFLSDEREEISYFRATDDGLLPQQYQFKRTGTGSDKKLNAVFDADSKQIMVKGQDPIAWQGELDNQLYRLDVQYQLAKGKTDFTYHTLNYRGQVRDYELKVVGKEALDLPFGKMEGIKVQIMRTNSDRLTYAWFAPDLDFTLVRLQQFRNGDEQGDIQLTGYKHTDPQ